MFTQAGSPRRFSTKRLRRPLSCSVIWCWHCNVDVLLHVKFDTSYSLIANPNFESSLWGFQDERLEMKLLCVAILSGILMNFICAALSCSPDGRSPLKPTDRVRKADFVIHGTVRASPRHRHKKDHLGFYSALFEVHCIFKGGKLPKFVNVSGFGFVGGLCARSNAYLNKTYIAFIRRDSNEWSNSTRFVTHWVNSQPATINVKHKPYKSVLKDIAKIFKERATLPEGASKDSLPGCPKLSLFVVGRPCHPKSNKPHKKRKHKKCHVSSTPSTQFTHSTKGLTSSRKTLISARVYSKETVLSTTTRMKGNVEFLLQSHSSVSRTTSLCWCFVLIFHGLVLVVVKWHQTWFVWLCRGKVNKSPNRVMSAVWFMIVRAGMG